MTKTMPAHLRERYENAVHRVQSVIAFRMAKAVPHISANPSNVQRALKHIRVGVDSSFSSQKALTELLIAKGVFTMDEYVEAITVAMEQEADAQVASVQDEYGLVGVNFE